MKKLLIMVIASIVTICVGYSCFASFQTESKTTVYRGAEWHFDIEERENDVITILPNDRKEPQVYGNGMIGKIEPNQKKYDIIYLK